MQGKGWSDNRIGRISRRSYKWTGTVFLKFLQLNSIRVNAISHSIFVWQQPTPSPCLFELSVACVSQQEQEQNCLSGASTAVKERFPPLFKLHHCLSECFALPRLEVIFDRFIKFPFLSCRRILSSIDSRLISHGVD